MYRCKACGSSAQFKLIDFMDCGYCKIEQYKCGCGATTEVTYTAAKITVRTAEGIEI
jgi:hypothetical protein